MSRYVIEGGRPLNGTITPAGNKNEALPVLMACLLTDEDIVFHRMPRIKDVLTVCEILEKMGVEVDWQQEDTLRLNAKNVHSYKPDKELCSYIRASILLIGPLLARFGKIELTPPGGDVIGARRLDTHFESIEALGAQLEFGNPIRGSIDRIIGADIYLDEPAVTATENVIMLAVNCEGSTIIHNAACEPHVVGLCKLLNQMGAKISGVGSNRLEIEGVSSFKGAVHKVGPDFMEIGSFLCLGAISKGKIKIQDVNVEDLRFVLKTLSRIGIKPEIGDDYLLIDGTKELVMRKDLGSKIASIYSGPWPAFPSDLMSVTIVAATQAHGTMIFHEKMFEGRMFFTDKLLSMGANIVLCDPHRLVVYGPSKLSGARMSSPDVRAGMALLMAASVATGKSYIDNIYQIERGYLNVEEKFLSLGAAIKKEHSV